MTDNGNSTAYEMLQKMDLECFDEECFDQEGEAVGNETPKDTFVWRSLDKTWSEKLLSDRFVEKDCVGDGNCQFRSIETALTNAGHKATHRSLRSAIARHIKRISNDDFFTILQNYRIEQENGDFVGEWDPHTVRNKKDFIREISKTGFHFEGDDITLSLLSNAIGIDFVILNNEYNILNLSNPDALKKKVVILYYDNFGNTGHYKTIGLRSKHPSRNVKTMFKRDKLPKEIDILLDKHTLFLEHIKHFCGDKNVCNKLTLNKVLTTIEKQIQMAIVGQDKRTFIRILRMWLENEGYFSQESSKLSKPKRVRAKQPQRTAKSKSLASGKRSASKKSYRSKSSQKHEK
jgi:hypothetical protein